MPKNGEWISGRQYWDGTYGQPGQINPLSNQQGAGQMVSAAVNQQSSVAQGKAPSAIQDYFQQQTAQQNAGGGSGGAGGGMGASGDVFDIAKSIMSMQTQANQPVVDTLKGEQSSIDKRYEDLLTKIKGNQTEAVNKQTIATNTELGNRGIGPDSGLYQTTLNNAVQPVNQTYQDQTNSAVDAQTQSRNDLALRIAQAQTGDPLQAIQLAQSLTQSKTNNPYVNVGDNSSLFNTQTGQFIQNPNSAASAASGW